MFIDRKGLAQEDGRTNSQIHLHRAQNSGILCVRGRKDW